MKVTLLSGDALSGMVKNAVLGALTCTGNEERIKEYDPVKFLTSLVERGHESVIEHINLTFRVEGISRALLQELARHRHISLSVRSTRYTLGKMALDPKWLDKVTAEMKEILSLAATRYSQRKLDNVGVEYVESAAVRVLEALNYSGVSKLPDLGKYFLPDVFPTAFMLTLNARELRHIFKLRSRPEALHEFQYLTKALYDAIPEDYRGLFKDCMHED